MLTAKAVLILGQQGEGKSSSLGKIPELGIEGLPPASTALINVSGKPTIFKPEGYIPTEFDKNGHVTKLGNILNTDNPVVIMNYIANIANNDRVKYVVLDDFQYIMGNMFMRDALKGGFDKFNKMGHWGFMVLDSVLSLTDKFVIVTGHSETYDLPGGGLGWRAKTAGQMFNKYTTMEGKFSFVMYCHQEFNAQTQELKKFFVTRYDGVYPAKTPPGVFEDVYIPNDMNYVTNKIEEFYKV